ncbi:MAG: SusD/RagB family nutrient-binding outer membrane lipoprotein [Candidatus Chryseobacterium colombiense]|nr:SusD/RagB family nutrient-binding outer membrane lipoprotein [Chryseobacterium sp.]WEK69749.1 MAG: SusD/RagB family nutrient-binding outer membrane lipoprotein [Chryseobacterium sp.]
MKNIILKFFGLFAVACTLTSCDRNFEEINTDTSKLYNPTAGSLLAPVQYNMASTGYMRANDFTFDIMQEAIDFPNESVTNVSRYYISESTGTGYWNSSYKWLKQVRDIYNLATAQNNKNYQAIAMVMNAWLYANLTDTFGDIPFSEASQLAEGISQPKFDKQKDIYIKLLDDLKTANSLFVTTTTLTDTDLFYNANKDVNGILKWKKFCNSLSLRLLTRILKKNGEINVYQRINEIVNDPTTYPIFTANTDSAMLGITGIEPLSAPIARYQDFTTGRAAGEFFINTIKNNSATDPRLARFFSTAKDLATNASLGYKGAPVGYAAGTTFSYQPSNVSATNLAIAPFNIFVMHYSELQFILAELAFKGIITGNAQTYYEKGVQSAIEQWGLTMPAGYLTGANVAYNNTLERIMIQKYLALFFVDGQQWFEQRRTGYPVMPNNGGLLNDGKMPQRLLYPPLTKVLNTENYQSAVQSMGGDNINVVNWWNQ